MRATNLLRNFNNLERCLTSQIFAGKSIHTSSCNFLRRRIRIIYDKPVSYGMEDETEYLHEVKNMKKEQHISHNRKVNQISTDEDFLKKNIHLVNLEHIDLKKGTFLLFPGQGSQYVGMGKDLYAIPKVKEMYDEASSILNYDLYNLSTEGPNEDLIKTIYQQPAIFVASLAAVHKLTHENPEVIENCWATAGFSVGELAALTFAGVLNFRDALQLVNIRAREMQRASDITPSGMMTVIHTSNDKLKLGCEIAEKLCKKNGLVGARCTVANYLLPNCKVIAGNNGALNFLEENSRKFGIRRIQRLSVSGAFHTRLMLPAMPVLVKAVENIYIHSPKMKVYSNFTGKEFKTLGEMKLSIPLNITNPVKWDQIMQVMYVNQTFESGTHPTTYECGPGKSLSVILKKTCPIAGEKCFNVAT